MIQDERPRQRIGIYNLEIADLIGRGAAAKTPSTKHKILYKKMGPEVNCFLFALCKGACFSEL